jgi:hypothetical protein
MCALRTQFAWVALVLLASPAPAQTTGPTRPPGNEVPLTGSPTFATCAVVDAVGNLVVGSEDQGVLSYTPSTGKWSVLEGGGQSGQSVYALAVDQKGRLWAGRQNGGVTVYNGAESKTYAEFGRDAALPGSHVYAIATSPADGDVWIATDHGLARWSDSAGTWRYYTRAEGLPTDQFRALAFDRDGDVYLASACEGVVIGRAADKFTRWEQATGPQDMPLIPHGPGIPSNLTNCVLVDARGIVYLGTTRGLAVSADKGRTWRFVRGRDWVDKARNSYAGVPPGWQPKGEGLLSEDWITSLAADREGMLWVGYRRAGYQRLDPKTSASLLETGRAAPGAEQIVTAIVPGIWDVPAIIRYGGGAAHVPCNPPALTVERPHLPPASLPVGATVPGARAMDEFRRQIAALPPTRKAAYLGEDWNTTGDWIGHYGRQLAFLAGLGLNARQFAVQGYSVSLVTGGHFPDSGIYTYVATNDSRERRALYDPTSGKRAIGETNDGSFNDTTYLPSAEGPDVWVRFRLPVGIHRISLYFLNNVDGPASRNACRDYLLELRRDPSSGDDNIEDARELSPTARLALEKLPVDARARVSWFRGGVYESFLVRQSGVYWIKVVRNHSFVGKIIGAFVDRLDLPPGKEPRPFLYQVEYDPPRVETADMNPGSAGAAFKELLDVVDQHWDGAGIETIARRYRLESYRCAEVNDSDARLLELGRWKLTLWSAADRDTFDARMREGFDRLNRNRN